MKHGGYLSYVKNNDLLTGLSPGHVVPTDGLVKVH